MKKSDNRGENKRLRIGIDIDNVISDSYPVYLKRFNQTFGTSILFDQLTEFYYLENQAGVEKEKVYAFIDTLLLDSTFHMNIPPRQGAVDLIKRWKKKGYFIHYITSRPKNLRPATKKWLEYHGFFTTGVTLDMYDETLQGDDALYKKEVVERLGIDIMIEDSKEIATVMNVPVLLLDRPWNQGELSPHITRVLDWETIEKFVDKLKVQ